MRLKEKKKAKNGYRRRLKAVDWSRGDETNGDGVNNPVVGCWNVIDENTHFILESQNIQSHRNLEFARQDGNRRLECDGSRTSESRL